MTISQKQIHYNLNLQYPNNIQNISTQTNVYIEYLMNKFINDYKDTYKDKLFILEYQDDLLSLITLRILKNIKTVIDFKLKIFGRKVKTKKYLEKNDDFMKSKQFNKYLSQPENTVFISCYNPYYKVVNSRKTFNDFTNSQFINFVQQFTPQMIDEAIKFYFLTPLKENEIYGEALSRYKQYTELCGGDRYRLELPDFMDKPITDIRLVRLSDNEQDNLNILQDIYNYNQPFFYFYEQPLTVSQPNLLAYYFSLANKTNIIDKKYGNVNETYLLSKIIEKFNPVIHYDGNWTEEQKRSLI